MIQEAFAAGSSQMHQLDPRLKLVFAALYASIVAVSSNFIALFTALGFAVMLLLFAHHSLSEVGKRALVVNGLILFLWLVVPLTFGGETLFRVGSLSLSRQGILLSARITLKSNAILLAFIAVIASTPMVTLGHALNRLGISGKIVHLLLMTYRYIFVIEQEYHRLLRSARIRGFRPRTNVHTYRTYGYLLGMLFVKASERAKRVHQAMICRGFKGKFYCLRDFSMKPVDWVWSCIMTVMVVSLGICEWVIPI
jgi:cobalt/nickel transport system permease protein